MTANLTNKEREQLMFELSFYKELVDRQPGYVDAFIPLGNAYTKLGMYHQGLEIDQKLLELKPDDSVVWYNYACSLALLERIDQALEALTKAVHLGYFDFDYMDQDPDLDTLKKDKRYHQLKNMKKVSKPRHNSL